MINKLKNIFLCQNCNTTHPRWTGVCSGCNSWNSIIEETAVNSKASNHEHDSIVSDLNLLLDASNNQQLASINNNAPKSTSFKSIADISTIAPKRKSSNIAEVDRVLGGGIVSSSVILIGGDPGIGKSTLLLQLASNCAKTYLCLYISGEESLNQIKMRADRLNIKTDINIATITDLTKIFKSAIECFNIIKKHKTNQKEEEHKGLLIIDSIQTIYSTKVPSIPGSINQIRACTAELINFGKKYGITIIIIGHVTKEGAIAGPRVLEHMVDTVIYFEGEKNSNFRILRTVKNRFGASGEIGIFDMTQNGLEEVENPSKYFVNAHHNNSGTALFPSIEGSRIILTEVQALVTKSSFAVPRRSLIGWDANRLSMILAVLDKICKIDINNKDIYLNFAGGLKINDPAADLAVAAALISSYFDKPLSKLATIFGEIGLSGEIRKVEKHDNRVKEAISLGVQQIITPKNNNSSKALHVNKQDHHNIAIAELTNINDLLKIFDE